MEENKRILYNAIQTPDGTILNSKDRHDYVSYTDKNGNFYSVDGGLDYLRRGYDILDYKDLSVYDDNLHETRREYLKWGVNYDKYMNKLPNTEFKKFKDLETEHIQNILDGGYIENNPFYKEVFEEELKWRKNENT